MKKTGLFLLIIIGNCCNISAQTKTNKQKLTDRKQEYTSPTQKEKSYSSPYYQNEATDEYVEQSASSRVDINQIKIGAYLSPNISWMHPTSSKSNDGQFYVKSNQSIVGFSWGLMADYFFTENYGLATGFQLNNTGGNIEVTRKTAGDTSMSYVQDANMTYRLQYLEIPICLKLKSDEIGSNGIRIFGQIGLSVGFNIGKKATYDVKYWDADSKQMTSVNGDKEKLYGSFTVAPMNLQLNIGGGIQRKISPKMDFYFGVFFNNGFLPDATKPDELNLGYKGVFTDGNIRLNNLAFRFGLFF